MSDSDKEVWVQFCQGSSGAFRELYNQYYSLLFTWGCKWVNNEPDFVRDVLHDFFIYLWEKKKGLAADIHVANYLLTSFRRNLFDRYKKEKKKSNIALNHLPHDDDSDIEHFKTQYNRVLKAFSILTPAQREVIELRYFQGFSLQQIADQKNTSLRTVYNLMYRAIAQLKKELGVTMLLLVLSAPSCICH